MTESKLKTSQNSKQSQNQLNQDQTTKEKINPIPMSNSKLYYGGYVDIKGFTVADNKEEAISNLRKELRLFSLPCEAEELVIPNYTITLTLKYIDEELR